MGIYFLGTRISSVSRRSREQEERKEDDSALKEKSSTENYKLKKPLF